MSPLEPVMAIRMATERTGDATHLRTAGGWWGCPRTAGGAQTGHRAGAPPGRHITDDGRHLVAAGTPAGGSFSMAMVALTSTVGIGLRRRCGVWIWWLVAVGLVQATVFLWILLPFGSCGAT